MEAETVCETFEFHFTLLTAREDFIALYSFVGIDLRNEIFNTTET
jgi:hypothetical protein